MRMLGLDGDPSADGGDDLGDNGVARLFVELRFGDTCSFGAVKLIVRASHEPPALAWREAADAPPDQNFRNRPPVMGKDGRSQSVGIKNAAGLPPVIGQMRHLPDHGAVGLHGREGVHLPVRLSELALLVLVDETRRGDGRHNKIAAPVTRYFVYR